MTDWLHSYVREKTREVAAKRPELAATMEKVGAVFMYGTIGHAAFLRPDGAVLIQDADEQWSEATGKERWGSIVLGAKHLPELRRLLPAQPTGAPICNRCSGSGFLSGIVCPDCGGLGWSPVEGAA
jgi:hypothetical protein